MHLDELVMERLMPHGGTMVLNVHQLKDQCTMVFRVRVPEKSKHVKINVCTCMCEGGMQPKIANRHACSSCGMPFKLMWLFWSMAT